MFNSATIWILIPLVAIIGSFITKWVRISAESDRRAGDKSFDELADIVRRLDQRVSNLERAVMDAEEKRKFAL